MFLSLFFLFFYRISFAFFAMIFLRAKKVRGTGEYEGRLDMRVKKVTQRKVVVILLISVLVMLFAGCAGEKKKKDEETIQVPEDTLLGYTYSEVYTPYQLSACDVKVEMVQPEDSELMVTKLLAGDSDYDFMVLSTDSSLATDILRTGAYYSLNDIPETAGLLDRYHAYIKEAATAENGDIWMIPCGVNVSFVLCREDLCEQYGLDFDDMTYLEFMEQIDALPKNGEHTFVTPYGLMTADITSKFEQVYGYEDMSEQETELLRSYMGKIRAYDVPFNEGKWWLLSSEERPSYISDASMKNIVFKLERSDNMTLPSSYNFFRIGGFRAKKLPDLEEGVVCPSGVRVAFIVINPKSDKLELTLQYVSQLCEKLQKDTTNAVRWMSQGEDFSDNVLREDIYRLISEGEVYSGYPYDVVGAELMAYREGKQEFDAMLEEIQRNIKMFQEE